MVPFSLIVFSIDNFEIIEKTNSISNAGRDARIAVGILHAQERRYL